MEAALILIGLLLVVIVFDLAVWRWGVDRGDGFTDPDR